jgi:hypothetical protein
LGGQRMRRRRDAITRDDHRARVRA